VTVALDTRLDEELIAEGCAREFINRIQNMRKDAGFEVIDRITIAYTASSALQDRLEKQRTVIMRETLADALTAGSAEGGHSATQDINGEEARVAITRVLVG